MSCAHIWEVTMHSDSIRLICFIDVNVSYVVTYNSRSKQFIILDSKGIAAWSHNSVINAGTILLIPNFDGIYMDDFLKED